MGVGGRWEQRGRVNAGEAVTRLDRSHSRRNGHIICRGQKVKWTHVPPALAVRAAGRRATTAVTKRFYT